MNELTCDIRATFEGKTDYDSEFLGKFSNLADAEKEMRRIEKLVIDDVVEIGK